MNENGQIDDDGIDRRGKIPAPLARRTVTEMAVLRRSFKAGIGTRQETGS